MNKKKPLSREAMCEKIYRQKMMRFGCPWRMRRDGKKYQAFWLTKCETKKLYRSKAINGTRFYRADIGYTTKQWQGVIRLDCILMIVRVAITNDGNSRITFTKEN